MPFTVLSPTTIQLSGLPIMFEHPDDEDRGDKPHDELGDFIKSQGYELAKDEDGFPKSHYVKSGQPEQRLTDEEEGRLMRLNLTHRIQRFANATPELQTATALGLSFTVKRATYDHGRVNVNFETPEEQVQFVKAMAATA